jgi:predicted Rossmann fold flavoprotein
MLPSRASVVVAGGGPAGFMAAITAAEAGVEDVIVLEATAEPLHKVLISGGGRCNVTHACWDPQLLVGHYPRGGRALRGPFARFAPGDTVAWFRAHGLELKQEADGRLFPRSDRSADVVACLREAARAAGVRLFRSSPLRQALPLAEGGFRLERRDGAVLRADRLVLATGSHPSGHRLVTSLGHTLVPPVPSLFTLALADPGLAALAGVTMDPVGLELLPPSDRPPTDRRPAVHRQRGAVLLTHWGLSGPATLRLTAFAARDLREWGYRADLRIDWSGGLSPADLEALFLDARRQQARRQLSNWRPWPALGRRLWLHLLERHGVDPAGRWADLGKRDERTLIEALRRGRWPVTGRGPFGEEFVTAGGVPLGQVAMGTMESRRRPGLFLAGEILDVDGVTGGFNFQHCWSSGWLAGRALAGVEADLT